MTELHRQKGVAIRRLDSMPADPLSPHRRAANEASDSVEKIGGCEAQR
jgi:hypothetical protein